MKNGPFINTFIKQIKVWPIFVSLVFSVISIFLVIEHLYFRPDYEALASRSWIEIAPKVLGCATVTPYPTIPKKREYIKEVCVLYMNTSNLTQLTTEIKDFTSLQELSLVDNRLTDLPQELAYTPLIYIDLGDNQFTNIPDVIFELSNLRKLEIGFNQISFIPEKISRLTKLNTLGVNSNNITAVHSAIGALNNLEFLELGKNQLTSLPNELFNLLKLKYLYLYNNRLTMIPTEIGNLSNLEILDLRHNKIESLPSTITKLFKLEEINLTGNPILPEELETIKKMLPWVTINYQ